MKVAFHYMLKLKTREFANFGACESVEAVWVMSLAAKLRSCRVSEELTFQGQ